MSGTIGRKTAGEKTARPDTAARITGLGAGTRILTLDGALPVEFLHPGDRVITRTGARVLRAITVDVCEDETVIRVRPGALGFDRPEGSILVGADQTILVRDWRARAMFGRDTAVVTLGRLVDGHYITRTQAPGLRLYSLTFDTEQVIYAEGLEIAALADRELAALVA